MNNTPVFIIIGQSNEGKSSIVSTLVGNDDVEIDHDAGTTTTCRIFPVKINGKKIIDFIDTPGFEHPKKILKWLRKNEKKYKNSKELFSAFYDIHRNESALKHDCQLILPIKEHQDAGLLYVFDGSRPMDQQDLWAMEIASMSGCGRIALINCRENDHSHLEKWHNEGRKYFSSVREFNAHQATFKDRIKLLKNMGSIVDTLHDSLEIVVDNLNKQRDRLHEQVAEKIVNTLVECTKYSVSGNTKEDQEILKKELFISYKKGIKKIEGNYRNEIKDIYKHQIFDIEIPEKSTINEDLFSEETWSAFGFTKEQLTYTAATIAAGGLLALFTGGLSLVGAVAAVAGTTAFLGVEQMVDVESRKQHVTVGPNTKIQFYCILLDRMILYYSYIVNRAHGKRDDVHLKVGDGEKQGFSSKWSKEKQDEFKDWLSGTMDQIKPEKSLTDFLVPTLRELDGKSNLI